MKPVLVGKQVFPCGGCLPCRSYRRRVWAWRIQLEALDHGYENCSFATLTYASNEVRDVCSEDVQKWIKRFRRRVEPRKIRYLLVGEYGDISGRPHYHAALFGHGCCRGGATRVVSERGIIGFQCECAQCSDVRETWSFGHTLIAPLNPQTSAYISGYVVKKLTSAPPVDRVTPFMRMSTRPGIGADAMWDVASAMMQYREDGCEVPTHLETGPKANPLGRYLRRKIHTYLGREGAPGAEIKKIEEELSLVRAYAFANGKTVTETYRLLTEGYAHTLEQRALMRQRNGKL